MMIKKWVTVSIASAIAATFYMASMTPLFAQPNFGLCDGLTGASFGTCRAGVAAGCDLDNSTKACQRISAQFEIFAGSPPPWVAQPACACTFPLPTASTSATAKAPTCNFFAGGISFVSYASEANQSVQANIDIDSADTKFCSTIIDNTTIEGTAGLTDAEAQDCQDVLIIAADTAGACPIL